LFNYEAQTYMYITVFTKPNLSVPDESMSHLKSYFSESSFNKYDICCEHGHL